MIHAHVHAEYSFLDGCGTSAMLAEKAAEMGQPALALTDHGVLCGALHHLDACEKNDVVPILGMEAYFHPDRTARGKENEQRWHLLLLAKNETGWKNLIRLSSESHRSGFYYKPRVDPDLLSRYGEGLIASASCLAGFIPNALLNGRDDEAKEHLELMLHLFGEDFFFEIQPHAINAQREYNLMAVNLASERGLPVLATADVHYPYQDWDDTHDVMLMISTRTKRSEREEGEARGEEFMRFEGDTYWLMDEEALWKTFFKNHPSLPDHVVSEAISNTEEWLLKRIEPFTISRELKIPRVTKSEGEAETKLRAWCEEGLELIGRANDDEYRQRMDFELEAMREAQFFDIIIIIGEMCRFAKREGIRKGPGRGSAAGSLVCYLCEITDMDPIGHKLLFERFLAPGRREPPDVDLDFQHDRRDEVKVFLADLLGEDKVAEICIFGTFALKNTLQFVGRVIDVPFAAIESATKTFDALGKGDEDTEMSLERMRELSGKLNWLAENWPELWRHAVRLEGQAKQLGTHAAGVVVTDVPIVEIVPTMRRGEDGTMVTAWSDGGRFRAISEYGFLKIDVLSTNGLTKQEMAVNIVHERTGEDIDLCDPEIFPSADPGTFDPTVIRLFAEGKTLGVFQFEAGGITEFLRSLKPDRFSDLVAANALYRPGPLEGGEANQYGLRKHGQEWESPHPALEEILGETYGVLTYQEQVMKIAQDLGDFTGAEADDLRKAMGKLYRLGQKVVNDFVREKGYDTKFVTNAFQNGMSEQEAREWLGRILAFGGYGFAKNHSCPYSFQGYQDAWLKLYYPWAFFAAFLTFDSEKVRRAIEEMEGLGIKLLPPDVNESNLGFTVVNEKTVRFGLLAVKGFKEASAAEILETRPFTSLSDFEERITKKRCNAGAKKALLLAGALDSIGGRAGGFAHEIFPWVEKQLWTPAAKGKAEKATINIALSNRNSSTLKKQKEMVSERIWSRKEFDEAAKGKNLIVGGEVTSVKKIVTKKGDDMGFCSLRFGEDEYELTLFPEIWRDQNERLEEGEMILAYGKKDDRGLIVETLNTVVELEEELANAN